MERQNKKNAERLQRDETRRINDMIERCHKWDPRIIEYKEQLKNAKKAGKQAKYAERAAVEEAARKKAEEEAEIARKAEAENAERRKVEKEQRETAKKALRRARKALRDAAVGAKLDGACSVKVDDLCETCTIEANSPISMARLLELAEQVGKVTGGNAEALPLLERELTLARRQAGGDNGAEDMAGKEAPAMAAPSQLMQQLSQEKKNDKDRKWSRDEMDTLHKALLRHPAGLPLHSVSLALALALNFPLSLSPALSPPLPPLPSSHPLSASPSLPSSLSLSRVHSLSLPFSSSLPRPLSSSLVRTHARSHIH